MSTATATVDVFMGIDADNHLPRGGLPGYAANHGASSGLRHAGWSGWADRTVTSGDGRPLLGHGPSGQLATVRCRRRQ